MVVLLDWAVPVKYGVGHFGRSRQREINASADLQYG